MRSLLLFHRCTFYYFYKLQIKLSNPSPEFGAVCNSSGWIVLNIFNVATFLLFTFNLDIVPEWINSTIILVASIILLWFNYMYLIAQGRLLKIIEEIESLPELKRKSMRLFALLYAYGTIGVMVLQFIWSFIR